MENFSLQIHKTGRSDESSLALEGTVLILKEKNKIVESETQIPVELIAIRNGKKFKGKRLIIGLLFPLVTLITFIIIGIFIFDFFKVSKDSIYFNVYLIVGLLALFLSIIVCCVYIVKFLVRINTVCLVIAPHDNKIEFWENKKDSQKISRLLEQIKKRQTIVEKPLEHPAKNQVYTNKYSPTLRFLVILFLFTIPSLITENPYLLLLILLPLIEFAYRGAKYLGQPKEYRQAVNFYIRKNWSGATNVLNCLKEKYPEYSPAYELLIIIYIQTKQFAEALRVAANLSDKHPSLAQKIQTDVWYLKRLHERRGIQSNL